ncbi:hypothetical protein J3D46_004935 [Paenarthrobacter sp. A20]|nr:hypothetical protein [Paenarthrobacter sp. A20]
MTGATPDAFAIEEHWSVVLLAFSDDDYAIEGDSAEESSHSIDSGSICRVVVTFSDVGHGANRGSFGGTEEFHAKDSVWVQLEPF